MLQIVIYSFINQEWNCLKLIKQHQLGNQMGTKIDIHTIGRNKFNECKENNFLLIKLHALWERWELKNKNISRFNLRF